MGEVLKGIRFDKGVLQQICGKHLLGKIHQVVYSQSGMVNPCVFINDTFVIRFNVRDPKIPKFRREKMAMRLLKERKILVPEVVALDEDRDVSPYDFLICKKVAGNELYKVWEAQGEAMQQQLCGEMGEILAQIHGVTFPKFGEILPNGEGLQFEKWSDCVRHKLEEAIEGTKLFGLFEEKNYQQVRQIFENQVSLLDTVQQAVLVHNDYHLGNMIVNQGHIASILDFEWCFAGDPEFDFREPVTFEGVSQNILPYYQQKHPLSAEFEQKNYLYRLLLYLQLCDLSNRHDWGEKSKKSYKKQFLRLLEQVFLN
ncbi:MAG: phosphotransferase family protein [Chitinophagales bacterium]